MNNQELANWVQAVLSVLAIVASVLLVNWQHRRDLRVERLRVEQEAKVERLRVEQEARDRIERVRVLIKRAQQLVSELQDNPDEPSALATHWGKNSNDVNLELAQVEFLLAQLQSVPVFDVPAGVNMINTLHDVAYALISVRRALSHEVGRPFDDDTPLRVSSAIPLSARVSTGKATLQTQAIAKAMRDRHEGDA